MTKIDYWAGEKEKARQDIEKEKGLRELALDNGLILVQTSPQIYLVIKLQPGGIGYWRQSGEEDFSTNLYGVIVFRGSWSQCRNFIAKNSKRVPKELLSH